MDRYKFEARDIWNKNETGVTTVQKPNQIVAQKGIKQVGAVISAEHGRLVIVFVGIKGAHASIFCISLKLLLDNHVSHTSIHSLDYCKINGIVLLSLHTAHTNFNHWIERFLDHSRKSQTFNNYTNYTSTIPPYTQ